MPNKFDIVHNFSFMAERDGSFLTCGSGTDVAGGMLLRLSFGEQA
ncbi:hypothetical protein [Photobacterium gaetbulicola]|nr:hypothetical protein [Photobacterium gaetbulicola]